MGKHKVGGGNVTMKYQICVINFIGESQKGGGNFIEKYQIGGGHFFWKYQIGV